MQNFITVEQLDGRKVSYFPTPSEFSASGLGYEKVMKCSQEFLKAIPMLNTG